MISEKICNRSRTYMYHRLSSKSSKHTRSQAKTETCRVQGGQILDVFVLELVERLVRLPKTVSGDRI